MAIIITVTNNKGGTGKTTTTISTAAALRAKGLDVLIIDYDGQANVTLSLRVDTSGGTVYDCMEQRTTMYVQPVRVLNAEGGAGVLDVLPSCRDLSALDVDLAEENDRITRFSTVVAKYRDKYDVILIDTPPTVGILSLSALYAADRVIVTVQPEFMAVQGLIDIQDTIANIAKAKTAGLPYCVLVTLYDKRKGLHRLTVEQVEASGTPTFATRIRNNVALGEAPAVGVDILRYAPNSNGAQDYTAFAAEVVAWTKVKHVKHRNSK